MPRAYKVDKDNKYGRDSMNELILYQTEDGLARVQLRVIEGGVWLSQLEIAELFASSKQNVSLHVANILKEGELNPDSVVKESLTTAADVHCQTPCARGRECCHRWWVVQRVPEGLEPQLVVEQQADGAGAHLPHQRGEGLDLVQRAHIAHELRKACRSEVPPLALSSTSCA